MLRSRAGVFVQVAGAIGLGGAAYFLGPQLLGALGVDRALGGDSPPVSCESVEDCGTITVVKDSVPNHAQDFTFSGTLDPFTLDDDPGDGTHPNQLTFGPLLPGEYVVTEDGPPATWGLTNIACDTGETTDIVQRTVTVDLVASEDVTCTFTNGRSTITIKKKATPDHPHDFEYTGTGSVTLDDDTDTPNAWWTSAMLVPDKGARPREETIAAPVGQNAVTESAAAGWKLKSIVCSTSATISMLARTAVFDVTPSEHVTCTFKNQAKLGSIKIKVVTDPPRPEINFGVAGAFGQITLGHGDSFKKTNLPYGEYEVKRRLTPGQKSNGWEVTDISCTSAPTDERPGRVDLANHRVNVLLDPGEDAKCTFTYTKP